jgi:hypothetical protein
MMSKLLVMAQHVHQVTEILKQITDAKIIAEYEMVENTPYHKGWLIPGYTDFIVTRTRNLIAAYKFKRPLAVVLDQRHQTAVQNIDLPSIRVCDEIIPVRISHAVSYKTNHLLTCADLTSEVLQKYFIV